MENRISNISIKIIIKLIYKDYNIKDVSEYRRKDKRRPIQKIYIDRYLIIYYKQIRDVLDNNFETLHPIAFQI